VGMGQEDTVTNNMKMSYTQLVEERNKMKRVLDTGRKSQPYYKQAQDKYAQIQAQIKFIFRANHHKTNQ